MTLHAFLRHPSLRTLSRLAAVAATATCVSGAAGAGHAAAASVPNISLGVDVSSAFYNLGAVNSFDRAVGQKANIVQSSIAWSYKHDPTDNQFPYWRVKDVLATGAVPEISWDPTINRDSSENQPDMSLASIANGDYDAYIRSFAQSAASVGGPVLLRFAHEMNGSWTTYAESNSGNHPGDFVAAWRHVWRIFQSVGATNVQWIWSPNAATRSERALAELYPGDGYVDWVGLGGYSYPLEGCTNAAQIFGATLSAVSRFSSRPLMLSETGISSECPNKPALISYLFSWLKSEPQVRSFTWWDRGDDAVNTSAASLAAFRAGLRTYPLSTALPSAATAGTKTAAASESQTPTASEIQTPTASEIQTAAASEIQTPAASEAKTVSGSAATDPRPIWGLIGDDTDPGIDASEIAAGVGVKVVRLSWKDFETAPGVFSSSYEQAKQAEIATLRSQGFQVILDSGLQDSPQWIHQYPDSYLVDQYGEQWRNTTVPGQTIDDSDANLIFNPALRAIAADYLQRIGRDFASNVLAIRIGGGRNNELGYPVASTPAHKNTYWAFDADAQLQSPVPGWKPGDPSPGGQAAAFLKWYEDALTAYQQWQISTLRTVYGGPLIVLYPGWGIRPGQIAAAAAAGVKGTTAPEINGEIQMGHNFADQVAAIGQPGVWVETTWLDAPEYGSDSSSDPAAWTPVHYLASLAASNSLKPQVWGENTGQGSARDMQYTAAQACTYGLSGVVWYRETELLSDQYATLPNLKSVIAARCSH